MPLSANPNPSPWSQRCISSCPINPLLVQGARAGPETRSSSRYGRLQKRACLATFFWPARPSLRARNWSSAEPRVAEKGSPFHPRRDPQGPDPAVAGICKAAVVLPSRAGRGGSWAQLGLSVVVCCATLGAMLIAPSKARQVAADARAPPVIRLLTGATCRSRDGRRREEM